MIIIGDGITGLDPAIRRAILERNRETIQMLARRQVDAGADYLDLNVGTAWPKPAEVMSWLVTVVQEAVSVPLVLDSRRLEVIEAALRVCRNPAVINSATGEKGKISRFMELAVRHAAMLIAVTMDEDGIPPQAAGRISVARRILDSAGQFGLPRNRLFIDPVLLPLKFFQAQGPAVLSAIQGISEEKDPPHIVVGLSVCSQGMKDRGAVRRGFLSMAIAFGLDAVIGDVLDPDLMETVTAAEMILERRPYSDQSLQECKKKSAAAGQSL